MKKFIEYYAYPEKESNNFKVILNGPCRPFKSLRKEVEETLTIKANEVDKPICALVSGGKDSQLMLISLMDLKIPFKPVHLAQTYNGKPINKIELDFVLELNRKLGINIEPIFIEVNNIRYPFLTSMAYLRFSNPYLKTHNCIGMGGDFFLGITSIGNGKCSYFDTTFYLLNENVSMIPKEYGIDLDLDIYRHRAELMFSFMFHPISMRNRNILKDGLVDIDNLNTIRFFKSLIIYEEYGDEVTYFRSRNGREDYPSFITEYDNYIYSLVPSSTKLVAREHDLKKLMNNEIDKLEYSTTINQKILKNSIPPREMFGL